MTESQTVFGHVINHVVDPVTCLDDVTGHMTSAAAVVVVTLTTLGALESWDWRWGAVRAAVGRWGGVTLRLRSTS